MFAGIGGFRAGLTRAGGFQCVGHCEIDKYADASYRAIHDIRKEEVYYPDATKIDPGGMPDFDLLCAGFPCQSWSASGHKLGFADPRGALFFEIARLAEARKPAYLLLENVPRILLHDQGRAFATILSTLHELGYGLEWNVCDSADHQVPQSRRRVYIVGYLDPRCAGQQRFSRYAFVVCPIGQRLRSLDRDIRQSRVPKGWEIRLDSDPKTGLGQRDAGIG